MPSNAERSRPAEEKRPSLGELAYVLTLLSMTNYGGAQSVAIQREVLGRRWLSEDTFFELRFLSQLGPGANSPNLALLIGRYHRGLAGACVAFAAATIPGVLIVFALGAVTLSLHNPWIAGAFGGFASAAIGAALANAMELTHRQRRNVAGLAIALVVGGAVTAGLSLWITLAVALPISWMLEGGESASRRP